MDVHFRSPGKNLDEVSTFVHISHKHTYCPLYLFLFDLRPKIQPIPFKLPKGSEKFFMAQQADPFAMGILCTYKTSFQPTELFSSGSGE